MQRMVDERGLTERFFLDSAGIGGWHIGDLRMRTIALVLIFVVQPLHDLWLTKKYELDKFTSVGELVAAHPEAKKKIYKPTID